MGDLGNLAQVRREVAADVGFVEDDDGAGSALFGDDEVAFEAADAEVVVEGDDDEHDVHVGGDDLLFGGLADLLTGEYRFAGQDLVDVGGLGVEEDPIADGRRVGEELVEGATALGAGGGPEGVDAAGGAGYAGFF